MAMQPGIARKRNRKENGGSITDCPIWHPSKATRAREDYRIGNSNHFQEIRIADSDSDVPCNFPFSTSNADTCLSPLSWLTTCLFLCVSPKSAESIGSGKVLVACGACGACVWRLSFGRQYTATITATITASIDCAPTLPSNNCIAQFDSNASSYAQPRFFSRRVHSAT